MTPDVDADTHTRLAALVLTAQRQLPRLTVHVTPHTHHKQWIIDHCCSRIWVSTRLPPDDLVAAARTAIHTLLDEPRPLLVPTQRCNSPVMAER
ncbi:MULTISPECIES: hypothetical protein [Pseudonocardia]|uniref:hypothetical protein n=1 Tax=Pseudonocardia TaxID=1847 RepID=UPI000A28BC5A|nr:MULTISPECIES: hypothetical protein [Pseudonocardia]